MQIANFAVKNVVKNLFRVSFVMAIAFPLMACGDYLSRRETLSPHAGDAVAANKAIHVIDPWPKESQNVRIPANGERMQRVLERYRKREDAVAATTPTGTTGN